MPRPKKKPVEPHEEAASIEVPSAYVVRLLVEENGNCPFLNWRDGLRDMMARARITMRITRILRDGNFGDHRERISGAVSELRIDYGPVYRVYYAQTGNTIVVLLGGGTKERQQADIEDALRLWEVSKEDAERFSRDISE